MGEHKHNLTAIATAMDAAREHEVEMLRELLEEGGNQ